MTDIKNKSYFLPCALLHDGADELANEGQELLCVSGVELLEQGEQAEHQRRPVNWVCCFPAGHSWQKHKTVPNEFKIRHMMQQRFNQ